MQIAVDDIVNYTRYNQQPEHLRFVGKIIEELIVALNNTNSIRESTFNALDTIFKDVDWTESFTRPLIILHLEFLHNDTVIYIHEWLRQKCADIENIGIVSSESHLKTWWNEWCSVMHQKSFFIVELPFIYTDAWFRVSVGKNSLTEKSDIVEEKLSNLKYHYSYYAGTAHYNERSYVGLRVSELNDHCLFDSMYKLPDKQSVIDYVEGITYFKDQQTVDLISDLYDKNTTDREFKTTAITTEPHIRQQAFQYNDFIWSNDRCCFANITRETKHDCLYPIITEKTFRAFWHHTICIPVCYQSIATLEQSYGFKFPHDIFDYSYQFEKDFHTRINKLINSLTNFVKSSTIENLKDYYANNVGTFMHNAKIVKDMSMISERLYRGI
jgi:hypothetical protein